ncbi:competence/damage-inducible domain protein CinA [Ruminococcus sp. CAG:488]|nr:competence/damage-inducible domain protein CinA [Ruminococcus sp. CAG:488]
MAVCELISVGTEILLGDILNTDAQFLSIELAKLGISVIHQSTVGDNRERLLAQLKEAAERSDIIILSGGLGPTPDDLTKEVCCEFFGKKMFLHEPTVEKIKTYFSTKGMKMAQNNLKQAMLPKDCVIFPNDNGTAPGMAIEKDGVHILVLPGPPRELKPMFRNCAVPYLMQFSDRIIVSHNIRTFGIGESLMAERVNDLFDAENPTVAPYAKDGEALLRVTAMARTKEEAENLCKPVINEIKNRLDGFVYGVDYTCIEEAVIEKLKEKHMKVATAESCTGGLIAKRITDVPGASEVFDCGIISYANEIKHRVLGVSEDDLNKYGAVSEPVARQMAQGALKVSGADIAVSVTGIAGPDSDSTNKPVGLVYIGLADRDNVWVRELRTSRKDRSYNRYVSASNALNMIRLYIDNKL